MMLHGSVATVVNVNPSPTVGKANMKSMWMYLKTTMGWNLIFPIKWPELMGIQPISAQNQQLNPYERVGINMDNLW